MRLKMAFLALFTLVLRTPQATLPTVGAEMKIYCGANGVAEPKTTIISPRQEFGIRSMISQTPTLIQLVIMCGMDQLARADNNIAAGPFNAFDWTDVTNDINDLGNLGLGALVDDFWEKLIFH